MELQLGLQCDVCGVVFGERICLFDMLNHYIVCPDTYNINLLGIINLLYRGSK